MQTTFERGAFVLSIDTEQIWGYLDFLSEAQFHAQYPNTFEAHDKLLDRLCEAGVRATWFVVGGLALRESAGRWDLRMPDLPQDWVRGIPSGRETTAPLWFRPSFVERLRDAMPSQEIGLHGGLTHLVWTDPRATRDAVRFELSEGIKALNRIGVTPASFSFARNQEAYHEFLPAHGIRCFRGSPPTLAWRLGRTVSGTLLRAAEEWRCTTPPAVWPSEHPAGLWNIPASTFLYPIGPTRARLIGLGSRVERVRRGLEAAIRNRGIFHFCLHPENLAESPQGFSILDEILEALAGARERGDVEIVAMSDLVKRLEMEQNHAQSEQNSYQSVFEADRCC
jgi:hypothetical protein